MLEQSFPLQVGVSSYTIGTGGTIATARPFNISEAYIRDDGGNDFGMVIRPRDWWNAIGNRSSTITSQIPTDLFYDPQFPLGVINIFPTPLLAYSCYFDTTQDQPGPMVLTTVLSMPPGYERMYVANFAMELVLLGFETTLDQKQLALLAKVASDSMAAVKSTNMTEQIASYDDALISRSNASYNIYRG